MKDHVHIFDFSGADRGYVFREIKDISERWVSTGEDALDGYWEQSGWVTYWKRSIEVTRVAGPVGHDKSMAWSGWKGFER